MEVRAELVKPEQRLTPTIEAIRDYATAQSEDSPVILVNPAHGNEPYILGTAIARGVSKRLADNGLGQAKIVVPLLYPGMQERILMEENVDDPSLIHLDETFGDLLRDITYENGDFAGNLTRLNLHYDEVSALLRKRFSVDAENFDARSLGGKDVHSFSPRNIVATIESAGVVSIETPLKYFAFPILVSQMLKAVQDEPNDWGFSETDLAAAVNRMLRVESTYSQIFIPHINPLSYRYADDLSKQPTVIDGKRISETPALKRKYEKTEGRVEKPSIYVMFSGTDSTIDTSKKVAAAAIEAGIDVYSPPWVNVPGAFKASPDILTDRNIIGIFGRSGWGTGWQAQNLALPWIVTPYEKGDDPEIYFNNKTIEALKMGRALSAGEITPQKLVEVIRSLSVGTQALNDRIQQQFGTVNGIDFVSDAIAKDFLEKRK